MKQRTKALDKCLIVKQIVGVLAAAVDRGEPWAIRLWLAYLWGLPKPIARRAPERPERTAALQVTWREDEHPGQI